MNEENIDISTEETEESEETLSDIWDIIVKSGGNRECLQSIANAYDTIDITSLEAKPNEKNNAKEESKMKLHIDYDKYTFRIVDTFYMLKSIPTPYDVRISSSGEGLHIRKDGEYTYNDPLYKMYDDPRRLRMNRTRLRAGVSHNILWTVKKGIAAGAWFTIENIVDVWTFMCKLYDTADKNRKHYIPLPPSNIWE